MEIENTKPLFAEERQQKTLEIINNKKAIIVPDLCKIFNVSASTVRNDLRVLEKHNLIRRTHGGAILKSKVNLEPLPIEKEKHMLNQKKLIAKTATEFVEDGDTIAISTGTTTLEFAKELLSKKNLTIILNDIRLASFLEINSDFTLFMLGGIIRKGFHYVNFNGITLPKISIDKIFFSCNGLTVLKGATIPDFHLANNIRSLINLSSETILLCDSSKIGLVSFAEIAPIHSIDTIIIDKTEGIEKIDKLKKQGVHNLILAT